MRRLVASSVLLCLGMVPVLAQTKIPKIESGSKIFIAPMGGFENYVTAGIIKKNVPVVVVADRDKAGWAKMLFIGSQQSNEQASIVVRKIKTDEIVFAYSVNKLNSAHGKQSAGEACAKHLKEAIGKD